MKKILILFVITISVNALAQNKANTLLNEVSEKVKSYDNISLDFKYTLENTSENIKQETKGDVVMQGDKYRLNILGVTRLFDGQTLYAISAEDEEVPYHQIMMMKMMPLLLVKCCLFMKTDTLIV